MKPNIKVEFWPGTDNFRSIEYFNKKDQLHNENGPARQTWHKNGQKLSEQFWFNNKLHNEKGPATITYFAINGSIAFEEYWLDGKLYSKKNWEKQK